MNALMEVKQDTRKLVWHLRHLGESIVESINKAAPEIREVVVANVLNNANWNPEATYNPGSPHAGRKYDMTLSGQLLSTIGSKKNNSITRTRTGFKIGIGNIPALDALRSGLGSTKQNFPYWRAAVYGHKAPSVDVTFAATGTDMATGKDIGILIPHAPKMEGTPPTYMFKNGFFTSEYKVNDIIKGAIEVGLKGR